MTWSSSLATGEGSFCWRELATSHLTHRFQGLRPTKKSQALGFSVLKSRCYLSSTCSQWGLEENIRSLTREVGSPGR